MSCGAAARTCPPSCFMSGCSSLKRSYPWWKNVKWAYMKDSIWKKTQWWVGNTTMKWWCKGHWAGLKNRLTDFKISDLLLDCSTLICNETKKDSLDGEMMVSSSPQTGHQREPWVSCLTGRHSCSSCTTLSCCIQCPLLSASCLFVCAWVSLFPLHRSSPQCAALLSHPRDSLMLVWENLWLVVHEKK